MTEIQKIEEIIIYHQQRITTIRYCKDILRKARRDFWTTGTNVRLIKGHYNCCARGWINLHENLNPPKRMMGKDLYNFHCELTYELIKALSFYEINTQHYGINVILINDDLSNRYGYGEHPKTRVLTYLWEAIKWFSAEIKILQEQLKQLQDEINVH